MDKGTQAQLEATFASQDAFLNITDKGQDSILDTIATTCGVTITFADPAA